ncbi:hypothetical protein AQPE_1571 [Aquipluma nitroreducens]|uniref:Uncharacterized protein n=1 Tax=Aquipluma nitroreducens TaxID=2010828 RepID=A0A5K7S769_9BACT|nr:hypothetical protein AQPE_1571 [Aquipluma nitroreducens]
MIPEPFRYCAKSIRVENHLLNGTFLHLTIKPNRDKIYNSLNLKRFYL